MTYILKIYVYTYTKRANTVAQASTHLAWTAKLFNKMTHRRNKQEVIKFELFVALTWYIECCQWLPTSTVSGCMWHFIIYKYMKTTKNTLNVCTEVSLKYQIIWVLFIYLFISLYQRNSFKFIVIFFLFAISHSECFQFHTFFLLFHLLFCHRDTSCTQYTHTGT